MIVAKSIKYKKLTRLIIDMQSRKGKNYQEMGKNSTFFVYKRYFDV